MALNRAEAREWIICAAIFYEDGKARVHQPRGIATGIVICGQRHCNCFAILAELFPNREYIGKEVQGFLTSANRFVERDWAAKIAHNAGQTENLHAELTSENIY